MSNYNKMPFFPADGEMFTGWESIRERLKTEINAGKSERYILVVECYQGVYHHELQEGFKGLNPDLFIQSEEAFYPEKKIREITYPDVTDDAIFGYMTRLTYYKLLDPEKVNALREEIKNATGLVIVYGHAAAIVAEESDCLVYADMARWEIQLRQRKREVNNIGVKNADEAPGIQYKRAFFVDWRMCDKLKQQLFEKADFWLDTNKANNPKMILTQTLLSGLEKIVKSPFRTVPYFDPGPWGGQWMKDVCGLDKTKPNFAWSVDGVPEENSLLLKIDNEIFEIPSINLVFYSFRLSGHDGRRQPEFAGTPDHAIHPRHFRDELYAGRKLLHARCKRRRHCISGIENRN